MRDFSTQTPTMKLFITRVLGFLTCVACACGDGTNTLAPFQRVSSNLLQGANGNGNSNSNDNGNGNANGNGNGNGRLSVSPTPIPTPGPTPLFGKDYNLRYLSAAAVHQLPSDINTILGVMQAAEIVATTSAESVEAMWAVVAGDIYSQTQVTLALSSPLTRSIEFFDSLLVVPPDQLGGGSDCLMVSAGASPGDMAVRVQRSRLLA